jgi:hypothetical protein
MRVPHYLKPNHNSETVYEAIWFDTETDLKNIPKGGIEHWLKFGWACYRHKNRHGNWSAPDWKRFESIPEFWDWVESRTRDKTKLYMFCHNTNFDLAVLDTFRVLPQRGWVLQTAIIDGPPTILIYRRNNRTIELLDTLNFWRMPLEHIGRKVGLEKLEMPEQGASREAWDEYGKRDVEVIMAACLGWWDWLLRNDMGGFAPTLASQSMRTFRHRYMTCPIFLDDNEEALELARESFHGGRCECFRLGKLDGEFYLVDINSMYPYVMHTYPMPVKLLSVRQHATAADLARWCEQYSIVAKVKVRIDSPVLPTKPEGKLVFPTGRLDVTLTTPEILWVLQNGSIERISTVAVYQREIAFRGFVDELYGRRMLALVAHDTVEEWQFKILLNSFYGKWAQRGSIWEKVADTKDLTTRREVMVNHDTGVVTHYRQFGGIVQRKNEDGESSNSHPAIAAHITAWARMVLWEHIEAAGRSEVLYVDTDSLLCTARGFERLRGRIDTMALGALKVVGSYNHVELYGCKDYVFDNVWRTKGIRKKAVGIAPGVYEQQKWSSLRGMLREGAMDKPLTRQVRKFLKRQYDKAQVQTDGLCVPFHYW